MELLEYGKVTRVHGTKGEIRVYPFSSGFHNFDILSKIYIEKKNSSHKTEYIVEGKRLHKSHILLKLENLDNPEAAEELIGCSVYLDRNSLTRTDEDEYYWFELVGMNVVTTEGELVGKVDDLMETSAHGILIIHKENEEYLVPLNDKFVTKIDTSKSEITINAESGVID